MIMLRILFAFILLPGTLAPSWGAGSAADPWYEIELIVFERTGLPAQAGKDDEFPALPPAVETTLADAPNGAAVDEAYRLLGDAGFKLSALTNRLLNARAHAPLLHVAWRQPVTTDQAFPGVRIHAGMDQQKDGAAAAGGESTPAAETAPPLEGLVKLSRARFLHLNLDLRYSKVTPAADNGLLGFFQRPAATEERYRLQQARRVRSTELQYFDHPRFGAIVLVTPIDAAGTISN
jgi:hypothetical protein